MTLRLAGHGCMRKTKSTKFLARSRAAVDYSLWNQMAFLLTSYRNTFIKALDIYWDTESMDVCCIYDLQYIKKNQSFSTQEWLLFCCQQCDFFCSGASPVGQAEAGFQNAVGWPDKRPFVFMAAVKTRKWPPPWHEAHSTTICLPEFPVLLALRGGFNQSSLTAANEESYLCASNCLVWHRQRRPEWNHIIN